MMKCLIILLLLVSCSVENSDQLVIETSEGDIEVELYRNKAPQTVAAFIKNVEAGIYDDASFYRVLKADAFPSDYNSGIIQGGIHLSSRKTIVNGIPHETTNRSGLSHTDGIISMARTTPGSAASEFFICIGDQSTLDSGRRGTADGLGMAAFGKVIKGMKVVREIQNMPSSGDAFVTPVKIISIK